MLVGGESGGGRRVMWVGGESDEAGGECGAGGR